MDFNTVLQLGITTLMGAVCYLLKRMIQKYDDGIAAMEQKLIQQRKSHDEEIRGLDQKYNDLRSDLPLLFVTREDYIRGMNGIDAKLDKQDQKLDRLLEKTVRGGESCG